MLYVYSIIDTNNINKIRKVLNKIFVYYYYIEII